MVTPPAFNAAIPVGATMVSCLCVRAARFFRKVVLPVPAFPVRKIWLAVLLINWIAEVMLSLSGKISSVEYIGLKLNSYVQKFR